MKKELIAAVLLAVIFAGVMLNIRASERIVSSLMSEVDAAYAQLKGGDNESAVKTIDRAIERWLMLDGYTHIFIRHSEINSTTEAFSSLNPTSALEMPMPPRAHTGFYPKRFAPL